MLGEFVAPLLLSQWGAWRRRQKKAGVARAQELQEQHAKEHARRRGVLVDAADKHRRNDPSASRSAVARALSGIAENEPASTPPRAWPKGAGPVPRSLRAAAMQLKRAGVP